MKPNTSGWGNLGSAPSPPWSGSNPRTTCSATSAEMSPGTSGSPSRAASACVAVQGRSREPGHRGSVAVGGPFSLQGDDLCLIGVEERLDAGEALQHLVGRKIRAAGEHVAAGGEEGGGRPAAHVVAAVHVRVAVVVHADGQEVLVDRGDHARVRVARLVHDVAPVAPHGREREEDRAPEPASLREGGLAPRAPPDLRRPVWTRGEAEVAVAVHANGIPHTA